MMNKGNTLSSGQTLQANEYLDSGNGYYAYMENDSNFVIYQNKLCLPEYTVCYSKTKGMGYKPRRVVMQNDENLVIYDVSDTPTWTSGSS